MSSSQGTGAFFPAEFLATVQAVPGRPRSDTSMALCTSRSTAPVPKSSSGCNLNSTCSHSPRGRMHSTTRRGTSCRAGTSTTPNEFYQINDTICIDRSPAEFVPPNGSSPCTGHFLSDIAAGRLPTITCSQGSLLHKQLSCHNHPQPSAVAASTFVPFELESSVAAFAQQQAAPFREIIPLLTPEQLQQGFSTSHREGPVSESSCYSSSASAESSLSSAQLTNHCSTAHAALLNESIWSGNSALHSSGSLGSYMTRGDGSSAIASMDQMQVYGCSWPGSSLTGDLLTPVSTEDFTPITQDEAIMCKLLGAASALTGGGCASVAARDVVSEPFLPVLSAAHGVQPSSSGQVVGLCNEEAAQKMPPSMLLRDPCAASGTAVVAARQSEDGKLTAVQVKLQQLELLAKIQGELKGEIIQLLSL